MIPKIIHYCWFGKKAYPQSIKKCIESWQKCLYDYEFMLWTEDNSPLDIPFVQDAYKAKKYAFVADYIRFWALYNYGGIYLDTDMYVIKPFDELLHNQAFFAYEQEKLPLLGNGVIGAMPKNNFIRSIISQYKNKNFDKKNLHKIIIPQIVTECYNEYSNKNEITIYPFDYFHPFPYVSRRDVKNFMTYQTSNTFAIHLWNMSWGSRKAKIRDWVFYLIRRIRRK